MLLLWKPGRIARNRCDGVPRQHQQSQDVDRRERYGCHRPERMAETRQTAAANERQNLTEPPGSLRQASTESGTYFRFQNFGGGQGELTS